MSMRVSRALLLLGCGLLSACSSSYFSGILDSSRVDGDVATPGLIAWTRTKDQSGTVTGKSVVTQPTITLTLEPNSSPVTFQNAQADYYLQDAALAGTKPVRNPAGLNTKFFPFNAYLHQELRSTAQAPVPPLVVSVPLNGLVAQDVVDLTNLDASGSAITAIYGSVTLTGVNALGATIKTNLQVPINVTYTGP